MWIIPADNCCSPVEIVEALPLTLVHYCRICTHVPAGDVAKLTAPVVANA